MNIKVSASVDPLVIKAINSFKRNLGLKSFSQAMAIFLRPVAQEYLEESRVDKIVEKYGPIYAQAGSFEESVALKGQKGISQTWQAL